jgi:drug/metabolite transporter (DMT)-like permease
MDFSPWPHSGNSFCSFCKIRLKPPADFCIGSKPRTPIPLPRRSSLAAFQLAASVVLFALSQLFLKQGMGGKEEGAFDLAMLASPWVVAGILAEIGSLVLWLGALRTVPLSVAYNLNGATHALIPFGCWAWLGESISPIRWLGIALVMVGVTLSARSAAAVEEKL